MIISKINKQINKLINLKSLKNNLEVQTEQINIAPFKNFDDPNNKEAIYDWIKRGIAYFKEWYQPVDFGNGVIAHVTIPPDWKPQPNLFNDNCRGLSKWKHIIEKHIPDVKGKRILDLGCSSGVYSIELARMGAKEVIGIDRDTSIQHRSTLTPPPQNVVEQANFVKKAFELLDNTKYPIKYIAHNIGQLDDLKLGKFDIVLALAVVYHELDRMPRLMSQLATMTDHIILQSSQAHGGELGKYADTIYQTKELLNIGFTNIEIDTPIGYPLPMIIAKK